MPAKKVNMYANEQGQYPKEMSRYAVAIDMGGTNTAFALVRDDGVIVARNSIKTRGKDAEEFFDRLSHEIKELIQGSELTSGAIRGCGIGAPCADYRTGMIEASSELPWPSPIPIGHMLRSRLAMPVTVSNDANAAAVGEMLYGVAKGMQDFILLTLGTGVGSGIVSEGRLLTGHRGFAGELGHSSVHQGEGRQCRCGRKDCVQTYCSASGVVITGRQMLAKHGLPDNEALTALEVGQAADRGEAWAMEAMEHTGEVLGRACSDFVTFSDPEAIILFGGVANSFRHIEPAMRRALEENSLSIYQNRVRILLSGLDAADAALLGSAALAFA